MSSQPKAKLLYTYRKMGAGGNWTQAGIPYDRGYLSTAIQKERQNVENTRTPSTGVIKSRGAQRMWWAIIQVDEDVTPAKEMTDDEMRLQDVVNNG